MIYFFLGYNMLKIEHLGNKTQMYTYDLFSSVIQTQCLLFKWLFLNVVTINLHITFTWALRPVPTPLIRM